jgi:hypothetical protein
MQYAVENALFQWREGERRLAQERPERERTRLEAAVSEVVGELRRRLGSSFQVDELADLYGAGTDWAAELAARRAAGVESPHVVDAAFARYAREASNYAGGVAREGHGRPQGDRA